MTSQITWSKSSSYFLHISFNTTQLFQFKSKHLGFIVWQPPSVQQNLTGPNHSQSQPLELSHDWRSLLMWNFTLTFFIIQKAEWLLSNLGLVIFYLTPSKIKVLHKACKVYVIAVCLLPSSAHLVLLSVLILSPESFFW